MDTQMNQMPPQAATKKGYGAVIGIVVLILLILAAFIFWPKKGAEQVPPSTATTQTTQQTPSQSAQAQDLDSLQADLDATNVDGVSNSL